MMIKAGIAEPLLAIIIIIIIIIIYLNCKWDFTLWQWYYKKTKHTNTHVTQNNTTLSNKSQHTKPYKQ
jgi:hypothetical protein